MFIEIGLCPIPLRDISNRDLAVEDIIAVAGGVYRIAHRDVYPYGMSLDLRAVTDKSKKETRGMLSF